jgi:hypothetical protein
LPGLFFYWRVTEGCSFVLWRDIRGFRHAAPSFHIAGNHLLKFGRRVADRLGALGRHPRHDLRRLQSRGDLAIEPRGDFVRRSGRREQAEPLKHVVAGQARFRFRDGRHIRQ